MKDLSGRVNGIIVVISHFEPTDGDWDDLWPNAAERRRLQQEISDGQVLLVMFQVFAEIVLNSVVDRVGGTRWGPGKIPLDEDPTKELVEQAYDGRLHLGDLYGDLRMTGIPVLRWDLYAAPFRLEMEGDLSHRLADVIGDS